MPSDYAAIRSVNERRYGTDIVRIGPMLLSDRYDEPTHFIFELLQNAEDALRRRPGWTGSRAVRFQLSSDSLRVSHYGKPFDLDDVTGICGIGESRKGLTDIGRFGIGFKSVYAFTTRPEVHSGAEDFVIESYVWPDAAPPVERDADETVIVLPLDVRSDSPAEILRGLRRLGPSTLLFLRHANEVSWQVTDASGVFWREDADPLDSGVRLVTVGGEEDARAKSAEHWLVFSRSAKDKTGTAVGEVEVAFRTRRGSKPSIWSVRPLKVSPLSVVFPTVLETNLGFLANGPYRTTPSRDNVPRRDPWNQSLVGLTSGLLVDALKWLRAHEKLDTAALVCLPLDRSRFGDATLFAPVFERTRAALASAPLLPRHRGGHVAAESARLARTQELRDLLSPTQLGALLGRAAEAHWISGDISQDRTPELRHYLMAELGIAEIAPESFVALLTTKFLEAQTDEWISRLYEFLGSQPALRRRLEDVEVVRLESGSHVAARRAGQVQAFLPGAATSFPTVRANVCASTGAMQFLVLLGLTQPNAVDDVVRNILPRYRPGVRAPEPRVYLEDVRRILAAFRTDSQTQRAHLVTVLRESAFVASIDAGTGRTSFVTPDRVYPSTDRMKALFSGIAGVLLVDESSPLRSEEGRELLEACGVTRYLRPVPVDVEFAWEQRREMRRAAGWESSSGIEVIKDVTVRGLDKILHGLGAMDMTRRAERARALWDALADLEERRGRGAFVGTYEWFFYQSRSTTFDAAFVRQLNETAWIPDNANELKRPALVSFDELGWKPNPFLMSKIRFRPSSIAALAREVGIEPGVFDLLVSMGVTSEAELRARLGLSTPAPGAMTPEISESGGAQGDAHAPATEAAEGTGGANRRDARGPDASQPRSEAHPRSPGSPGGRPFISYVGVHRESDEDPDHLDHEARLALEERAIAFILAKEPQLRRTEALNPGFDLVDERDDGEPARWIEVKAMTGRFLDRPAGLSRRQFDSAREHGPSYWLYVVENAADADSARIIRICDPAGKARTFTFDHGWLEVAELPGPVGD